MAGAWAIVSRSLLVALAALSLIFVGVSRSVRTFGLFNGRLFSRPAAPWTISGLALVAVDALALLAWLLSAAGAV